MLGLTRAWVWLIGGGIVMAILGIAPSIIVILALLGVVWMPIMALILWGRLLDEMVPVRRSGLEDDR
ncbi:MAG: hypothetical protein AAF371_04445 [Pseudomonadota bacterium]